MTNPPGAMPPLPEIPANEVIPYNAIRYMDGYPKSFVHEYAISYAQAYAAPLIARVAELERQNEAQKDEWLSWEAKRAALEKDAERYRWLQCFYIPPIDGDEWDAMDKAVACGGTVLDAAIDAAIAAKD